MFHFWTLCILLAATSIAVLGQAPSLVRINTKGFLKPRIGGSRSNKIKPRIANGDKAKNGDFPWHASLVIKYRSDHPSADPTFCSGAILNENWILTPAECVRGASTLRVDIGSVDINSPAISVYPDAFTLHPEFNENKFKNNIALLRLSNNNTLNFDEEVTNGRYSPIRLPKRSEAHKTFEGAEGYFSGFGLPKSNSNNVSERLLYAEQVVIPNTACVAYYGNDNELISSNVVCSQSINARQGACMADSGAPLVINEYGKNTLIGVLSFVHNEGNCGRLAVPAAFTRITSYFDWIERVSGYKFRP